MIPPCLSPLILAPEKADSDQFKIKFRLLIPTIVLACRLMPRSSHSRNRK